MDAATPPRRRRKSRWRRRPAGRRPAGRRSGSGRTSASRAGSPVIRARAWCRSGIRTGPSGRIPLSQCRSCGAGLAGAAPAGRGWGQVRDIPPVRLEKVHWLLPRLRCGGCGTVTCADLPDGQAGAVVYGPNVNAAAISVDGSPVVSVDRHEVEVTEGWLRLPGRGGAGRSTAGTSVLRLAGTAAQGRCQRRASRFLPIALAHVPARTGGPGPQRP
jgi:hypothetical protein